ncbi:MAG: hypothetical protein Q9188_004051 [Gyalolechia gomerana]
MARGDDRFKGDMEFKAGTEFNAETERSADETDGQYDRKSRKIETKNDPTDDPI